MKGNKTFIVIFASLFVLYIIAQLNQPREPDWTPTLRNDDKNPYGAYIAFTELKQLFPSVSIQSHRLPLYNVLQDQTGINSAYLILETSFSPSKPDMEELLRYVSSGNTVFIAAFDIGNELLDTLGLSMRIPLIGQDSASINFVNPALASAKDYRFAKATIDGYITGYEKKDSTTILGITRDSLPNFVKVQFGKGSFFIHAAPLCFSNYFMLYERNHEYAAKALSYLSPGLSTLHWDEYYKAGRQGANTPLRFFLSDDFLRWALWLTIGILLVYLFFEMKRRQRIIPVIEPLRNTTLDFVETVSAVYYSQHDNNNIARKKVQFWFEYIRQHYYLSTQNTDDVFVEQLHRKSGVSQELIRSILKDSMRAEAQPRVTDDLLMQLSAGMDAFYQQSKN